MLHYLDMLQEYNVIIPVPANTGISVIRWHIVHSCSGPKVGGLIDQEELYQ